MNKWDGRFTDLAMTIATWSKDPKRQVGCVIVDKDRHILATGYNGFPKNVDDSPENLNDQDTKREIMIHAEVNALLRLSGYESDDKTLYCTQFPCPTCASLILQKGIKRIVVPRPDYDHKYWGEKFKISTALLLIRVEIQHWEEVDLG